MLHLDLWAEKAEELAAKELEAAKTPQKTKKNTKKHPKTPKKAVILQSGDCKTLK